MSDKIQKYRFLEQFLPNSSQKTLLLLTGARQTGKTTLAKKKYPDLKYINLDAPENREAVRMILSSSWGKDVGAAVIDEAQKEPVVFEKIKYAYDEGSLLFEVILGSSQILLLKKIRESLAGRVKIFELWPLLMSEIHGEAPGESRAPVPLLDRLLTTDHVSETLDPLAQVSLGKTDMFCREMEKYLLQWGGMPALLPLSDDDRWKWLKDYEYTYLERDLSDLARLDDLGPFRKFQKLSSLRSGHLLNYSEVARDTGISVDTARRYLEYLRVSYQVVLIQPYSRNVTSSTVKTPKLYWLDIGLLRQLSGYRGEPLGAIYETMVVSEVAKWVKTVQRDVEIYFYRTRSGMEVDLLLKTPKGIIGMEIKSRQEVVPKDVSAMKEIASGLGREWLGGLVVYQGQALKQMAGPQIWAVPSRRLLI